MIFWCIGPNMTSIWQCWKNSLNCCSRITSRSTWRNVFLETRKFHTLVSLWHWKASNQVATSSKPSRMPNLQLQSKWWDILLGSAISLGHIEDFVDIAAPLFKVKRKDSGYKSVISGCSACLQNLAEAYFQPSYGFSQGRSSITFDHGCSHRNCRHSGRFGTILTQIDNQGNHYAISFASHHLKDHEKNYSPFLLEVAAAVFFNEYLRGKQFILFTDHKPLEKLGHLHTKMLNRQLSSNMIL